MSDLLRVMAWAAVEAAAITFVVSQTSTWEKLAAGVVALIALRALIRAMVTLAADVGAPHS
jgi:hypothetical protein